MRSRIALLTGLLLMLCGAALRAGPPQWIAPASVQWTPPEARWLWSGPPEGRGPGAAAAFLATEFDAPPGIDAATLILAADNHAAAFLNGVEVLRSDDWRSPIRGRVRLVPGRNVLAIRGENEGGPPVPRTNPAGV